MSWPHLIIYLVVFGVGMPSSLRNLTAAALCVNWMLGEVVWLATGNALPLKAYFMADVGVIAAICVKAIQKEGMRHYSSLWRQARAFYALLTPFDRWIAGGFIFAIWPLYVLSIDDRLKWFALWALLICQFLLAGSESLLKLLREGRSQRIAIADDHPNGGEGLAYARGRWSHG